jgi:hypothetical protein
MNEAVTPLVNLLSAKFGWMPAVIGWVGALRFFLKFFNGKLQAFLTQRMAEAAASQDAEDDRDFEGLLSARWYRLTNFIVDLVFSVKLPTHADFIKLKNQQQNNTGEANTLASTK